MESFGVLSLLPAITAITLCFVTKEVLFSLYAGLFVGCLVINNWNPIFGVTYSLQTLTTNMSENVTLLMFTLFMGVGISFIWRLGGSFALADAAKKRFKKRRSICLGTWLLGMLTSINDCLVAAVDGNVFRDICKDYRISSEKFSYVLDATAAPSAALFISDWIAYQIGMIGQGLENANITEISPVAAYIKSIPFNMYSILTLIFVGVLMYTGKDYGPMLKAEVRCLENGEYTAPEAQPMLNVSSDLGEPKKTKPMIKSFILPILLAIITIIIGIIYTGREGFPDGIMAVLENCDATSALLWGSFVMSLTGIVIALTSRIMTFKETMQTIVDGFKLMSLTGAILVLAWSLGAITKELGLAQFVIQLVGDSIPFGFLPPIVFLISIVIAFATGTSWGTMAIMTPLVIPLAYSITGNINVTVGMCGAVLSGALFGDHSSPVSDTTVMASLFSGADHIDHVKTQVPYAMTVAGIILVLYTIFGFTSLSPFILLPIGIILEVILMNILHSHFIKKYNIDKNYSLSMTENHK